MKNFVTMHGMVVALIMATGLISCTKTIKPEARKPVPLVALNAAQATLVPIVTAQLPQDKGLKRNKNVSDPILVPAINGNQLVAATPTGVVTSLLDGQIVWQKTLPEAIVGGVGLASQAQIAVVTTRSGRVIALHSQTGEPLWETPLGTSVLAPAVVANDRLLLSANNGVIYGLDIRTGAVVWQFSTRQPGISVRGTALPLRLDNDTALFGTADGRIHAIANDSGTPLWTRLVGTGGAGVMRDVDARPLVVDNHLYVTSVSGNFAGFDMSTGQPLFVVEDFATNLGVAHMAGVLIGADSDGMLYGFDALTGKRLWQNNALRFRKPTTPVAIGRYVAVGDYDGVVHLLTVEGNIVGRTQIKGAITNLIAKDNRLYAQTQTGTVAVWQVQ